METSKQIRIWAKTHKRLKIRAAEAEMPLVKFIDFISQKA